MGASNSKRDSLLEENDEIECRISGETLPHTENENIIRGCFINTGTINAPDSVNTIISGDHNRITINKTLPRPQPPERVEFDIKDCNPTFIAREEFLTELHEQVFPNQENTPPPERPRVIVIGGMAGIGKTQAVLKYIELNKSLFGHVLWINAQSYVDAKSCINRLAEVMSIDVNSDGKQKADKDILAGIYDYVCQKLALIVFDHVESYQPDDPENVLRLFLPLTINTGWTVPSIIVTTRYRDWPIYAFRELTGFNLSESLSFLSALEFEDTEENRQLLEEIANLCQGLPLALQQVISFFRIKRDKSAALANKDSYALKDLLTDVGSKKRKKFISTKPHEHESSALDMYKLFEMTFEQIGSMKYGDLALQCLDVMAILNPDCIPTVLIKLFFGPTNKLAKALSLLHKYTLVTKIDNHYRIHRMVQAVKIEFNNQNGSSYVQNNFENILDSLTKFLETLPTNFEQVHEILNNLIRFRDQARDFHTEKFGKFEEILANQLKNGGS